MIYFEIIDGYDSIPYNGFFRLRQGKSSNINVFLIVLRFIDDDRKTNMYIVYCLLKNVNKIIAKNNFNSTQ